MKCIMCKKEKKDDEFSEEHIFPDSIGGTLTIDCVCKDCNDKLGRNIDSKLVNHWMIKLARMTLGIRGKSGGIPNALERGVLSEDSSQKVLYKFDDDGNPLDLYLVPNINEEEQEDGSKKVHITLDKKDKDKLPEIVNKKLRRNNMPEMPEEEIYERAQEEVDPSPEMVKDIEMNLLEYQQAILKIAYELAYYCLGEDYLEDEIGELIRKCILDNDLPDNWAEKYPINGTIRPIGEKETIIPMREIYEKHHIGCLLKTGNIIGCYIKIFNIFEGNVCISKTAHSYPNFENKFISINPQTGEKQESTFIEEIAKYTK